MAVAALTTTAPEGQAFKPTVFTKDGTVFANSRDVAAYFGKRHNDVLRAIDKLIAQAPEIGLRNFAQTPYTDSQNGETYRSFNMDRDGFALLAMGFTGAKALRWKLKWIEAFNAMEQALRQPSKPVHVRSHRRALPKPKQLALPAPDLRDGMAIAMLGGKLVKIDLMRFKPGPHEKAVVAHFDGPLSVEPVIFEDLAPWYGRRSASLRWTGAGPNEMRGVNKMSERIWIVGTMVA